MDFLQRLAQGIFGGGQEERKPARRPQPAQAARQSLGNRITNQMIQGGRLPASQAEVFPQPRSQQQIRQAPFRMFEDMSFQGQPSPFMKDHSGFKFFEDNTFSPPQAQPRSQAQISTAPFRMFEDQSFQGDPRRFRQQNPGFTFYEDNTFQPPRY